MQSTNTGKTYLCQDDDLLWRTGNREKTRGGPLGCCDTLLLDLDVKIHQAVCTLMTSFQYAYYTSMKCSKKKSDARGFLKHYSN